MPWIMQPIAEDVFLVDGFRPNILNTYLIGDVLIDAGWRYSAKSILKQLEGRTVRAHALTHAHPDHQGASHAICTALNIPFWVSGGDAEAAETGDLRRAMPGGLLGVGGIPARALAGGPGHPVAKRLKEGDLVGGFTVIESPGHSPGHVSFWRERDRVLIIGDVVFNLNPFIGTTGLQLPPNLFTVDPTLNRASARKLAALKPDIVCFGHGPVVRDGARVVAFITGLRS